MFIYCENPRLTSFTGTDLHCDSVQELSASDLALEIYPFLPNDSIFFIEVDPVQFGALLTAIVTVLGAAYALKLLQRNI